MEKFPKFEGETPRKSRMKKIREEIASYQNDIENARKGEETEISLEDIKKHLKKLKDELRLLEHQQENHAQTEQEILVDLPEPTPEPPTPPMDDYEYQQKETNRLEEWRKRRERERSYLKGYSKLIDIIKDDLLKQLLRRNEDDPFWKAHKEKLKQDEEKRKEMKKIMRYFRGRHEEND